MPVHRSALCRHLLVCFRHWPSSQVILLVALIIRFAYVNVLPSVDRCYHRPTENCLSPMWCTAPIAMDVNTATKCMRCDVIASFSFRHSRINCTAMELNLEIAHTIDPTLTRVYTGLMFRCYTLSRQSQIEKLKIY